MLGSRRLALRSSAARPLALGSAIALFTALAALGDMLSPALRQPHPLALVLLTPRTPYLVAAANRLPFAVFLLASVARLCASDPFHFMLGRTTGPNALSAVSCWRWLRPVVERCRASGATGPWLAAVVASPTAKTMLATGAVGLRGRWVALANVVGTVARVVLIWGAGQRFPTMAQTCAAWTPWVVIPGMATAVVCGAVRWHQRLRNGPTPAPGERPCPVS